MSTTPLLPYDPHTAYLNQGYTPEVIGGRWLNGGYHDHIRYRKVVPLPSCERVGRVFVGSLGLCFSCCIDGYTDFWFRAPLQGAIEKEGFVFNRGQTQEIENSDFTSLPFDGRDPASVVTYIETEINEWLQPAFEHQFLPILRPESQSSGFIFVPHRNKEEAFYLDVWDTHSGMPYTTDDTKRAATSFSAAYQDELEETFSTVLIADIPGSHYDTFRLHREAQDDGEQKLLELTTTPATKDSICIKGRCYPSPIN